MFEYYNYKYMYIVTSENKPKIYVSSKALFHRISHGISCKDSCISVFAQIFKDFWYNRKCDPKHLLAVREYLALKRAVLSLFRSYSPSSAITRNLFSRRDLRCIIVP